MVAPLDNAAVVQHHDAVRVHNGTQAVGNDEHRSAVHQSIHAVLHQLFRAGVDGRSGLVQNHHGRIRHRRPGNGDQLPLALGQPGTVSGEHRLVTLGQPGDEIMGIGQLCRPDALLVGSVQLAVADVVHHRAGEQVGVLKHYTQRAAQVGLGDLVDVDIVVADLAVGNVIEAVNQVCNGCLARAGGAHEGDFLTGMGVQGHIMQHRLIRSIAEIHIVHGDVALQFRVGHGAVGLVGMLPGPVAGTLVGFGDVAVFVYFRIDQPDIALVLLRLLVHQFEDPLRTGQCHDNGIDLVGDLGNGHVEGPGQGQKADELANGEQAATGEHRHQSADNGNNRILDIAKVVVQGAHDVGVGTRQEGIAPQLLVQFVKFLLAGILVGEHLHHPLAADHFLHIAIHRTQRTLLANEEFS